MISIMNNKVKIESNIQQIPNEKDWTQKISLAKIIEDEKEYTMDCDYFMEKEG